MSALKEITVYTDGSSLNNPGPGGYGAVLIFGDKRKEISGGFRLTTNNRMEILSAIEALRAMKKADGYKIKIHTDSELLCNAFNKGWIYKWERENWKKRLNADLWIELLKLCRKFKVEFCWVKGHAGIPENERCDVLARAAASGLDLPPDTEYEKIQGGDVF